MNSLVHKLRSWQPAIVEKTLAGLATGNFLNASDLGTGKTYCAVATAAALNMKLLAVCRIGARNTWHEVGIHFGLPTENISTVNRELLRLGKTPFGHWERSGQFNHSTGKESKRFRWTLPKDTLLVVDEVHADSGMDSMNSQVLRAAVRDGVKILMLSGTAADDPRKMRAIGYALGLHRDDNFDQWLARQGATRGSWNAGLNDDLVDSAKGRRMLIEARQKIMAGIHDEMNRLGRFVRVRKSEIPNFPKCQVEVECIDFDSKELVRILADMNAELARLKAKSHNPKADQRELMIRAMQKAELLMVPGIVEQALDGEADGHSVAIFVSYTETVKAIAARLKTDCIYTGYLSFDEREANRLRFQSADPERRSPYLILNAGAGAESIGLQDLDGRFPRLGLSTPMFDAIRTNQLLGRLPRDGAKSISTYRFMYPAGTILEAAYHAAKQKAERCAAFNGDITFDQFDLTAGLNL